MWRFSLPAPARETLARAFGQCGPLGDDPEPFLASVFATVGLLPPDLTRALLRFRADPSADGMMLLEGMPIDRDLPPTPTTPRRAALKETAISEASVLLVALLTGEPVAYADEKDGVLVQDVYPLEAEKQAPSNESSDTDLGFHTELSFSRAVPDRPLHVANPDFLLLLGLRPAPLGDAVTTLIDGRDICRLLPERVRAVLRQPLFQLRAPYSFTRGNGGERPWSQPVPLFHGSESEPRLAFDLACGVRGLAPEASAAIDELRRAVATPEVHVHARLNAGDLLIVDNRKCAHARSRFEAAFDGTDRWLQRVYVRRSLDGVRHDGTPSFRII